MVAPKVVVQKKREERNYAPPLPNTNVRLTNGRRLEQELHRYLSLGACFKEIVHAVARIERVGAVRSRPDHGLLPSHPGRVVRGRVHMRASPAPEPHELEAGFVLACQSVPVSEEVAMEFDES